MFGAISTTVTADEMAEAIKNPPRDLVNRTCRSCPLFPTKMSNEPPHLIFMLEQASILERKQRIGIRWNEDELSARQVAARLAIEDARSRSDKKRMKKTKSGGNSGSNQPSQQQQQQQQPLNAQGNTQIGNQNAAMGGVLDE